MNLNETDFRVLSQIKELKNKHGRHAQEWVLRDNLRDTDKGDISDSLRRLHSFRLIKCSPFMNKAWIPIIEDNELEEMKKTIKFNNNSKSPLTLKMVDDCIKKFKRENGRCPKYREIMEVYKVLFGECREKDPERKIRRWGQKDIGLLEHRSDGTFNIPLKRRKELYIERPLMAYMEK